MSQNTKPIFPLVPEVTWATVSAANTATDGTGTVVTVFTAGANGSRVDYLSCSALGTNVTTVMRVFINNGSANSTASNNVLFTEQPLPSTTATNSNLIGPQMITPLNISLPAGFKINVVLGTAVSAGWAIAAVGGDY